MKVIYIRYISLLFLIPLNTILLAQPNNGLVRDVVWPAPNAASLGKYGDIPVSYNRGIPNIQAPIYSVANGPLNISLGLSYHAAGYRVAESASWVGLGWSLNAGGVITRTVLGLPDDSGSGYLTQNGVIDDSYSTVEEVVDGVKDAEPDIFSFNIGGYSGKFLIDSSKNVFLMPRQNLKIEIDTIGEKLEWFTIISPDGTKYHFGEYGSQNAVEESVIETSYSDGPIPTNLPGFEKTSWFLVKIESFDSEYSIDFEYTDEKYMYKSPVTPYHTYGTASGSSSLYVNPGYTSGSNLLYYHNKVHVKAKRLTKITTSTGTTTVHFDATTLRKDLDQYNYGGTTSLTSYRLDKIRVITGSGANELCSAWNFSYGYFNNGSSDGSDTKRLRLDTLQQKACDGSEIVAPYIFSYNGSSLPNRLARSVDHWGFNNGEENRHSSSSSLVNCPSTSIYVGLTQYTYGQAERESDGTEMKKGILTQLTYPTGGSTYFDFEANTVKAEETVVTLGSYLIQDLEQCTDSTPLCCIVSPVTENEIFTSTSQIDNAIAIFDISEIGDDECSELGSSPPYVTLKIKDGSTVVGQIQCDTDTLGSTSFQMPLRDLETSGTLVPDTTYTFEVHGVDARLTFSLRESSSTVNIIEREVGGLRVKEVRSSAESSQSSNDIIKTFDYTKNDTSTESSAVLYREPLYGKSFTVSSVNRAFFSSATYAPLGSFDGYHITYKRVVEGHNGNGKKEMTFFTETAPGETIDYEPTPPLIAFHTNGQLEEERVYDEAGTMVQETIFKPKFSDDPVQADGLIYKAVSVPYQITSTTYEFFAHTPYTPLGHVYRIDSLTKILDGVSVTTAYSYHPDSTYLFPVLEVFTNSDDQEYKVHTTYSFDMPSGTVKTNLLEQNRLLPALSSRVYVDDELVAGDSLEYSMFTTAGLPDNSSSKGPYPYQYYKYEMTFNSSGTPVHQGWDTIGTIKEYETQFFQPKKMQQRGWEEESFTWNSDGLIATRTFKDFTWEYDFFADSRLVSKITDVDGQEVDYFYDELMRLETIKSREDSVTTDYEYTYQSGSGTYNSVKTTLSFHQTTGSDLTERVSIQYLDGLGRAVQSVEKAYSQGDKDVIRAIEFDSIGRPFKAYEAFEGSNSNGNYVPKASWPDTSLYTLSTYEASPLNRSLSVRAPKWHATSMAYSTNTGTISIAGTNYTANNLFITTVTDPNGHKTITYRDKKGRDLRTTRKASDNSESINTVYVYDGKDRISKVLPPSTSLTNTELIYSYTYDTRDNISSKKMPEQSAISYWHDERNLLTYMQDPNMADQGRWLHSQYDDYGRSTASGFVTSAPGNGNTKANFAETLTRTYYDGYDFVGGAPDIYKGKVRKSETRILGTPDWLQSVFTYDTYGRVSKSESNHHQNLGNTQADVMTFNYDFADNITFQNRTHEYSSGYTTTINERMTYDHSGRLIKNFHKVNGGAEIQLTELSYTAKDQIAQKNLGKVGSSFLQSLDYTYRDNGFLSAINQATLGGTNMALGSCPDGSMPAPGVPSGTLDNNDLFYLQLRYDTIDASLSNSYKQYNGNVSQISWRVRGRERQMYAFKYDYQDRLISSKYGDQADNNTIDWASKRFNTFYEYDERGNFSKLSRRGLYWDGSCWQTGQIDTLSYSYWNMITGGTSNRLKSVSDGAPSASKSEGFSSLSPGSSYDYDANGNMTYDPNKDIEVLYNYFNLPKRIEIEDCKFIEFLYDAKGSKLRKTLKEGAMIIRTQDLIGGLEYTNDSLEAIYHSEGRVYFESGTSRYEYNISDHLGNTRLTFTDKDGDGVIEIFENADSNEVLSESHYYAFGMNMSGAWMNNPGRGTQYQYNGKELNEDFGLDWYDYGARWYDASIARWGTIDPKAEKYYSMSSYIYVSNNPLIYIDPFGMDLYLANNKHIRQAMNDIIGLVNSSKFQGSVTFNFTDTENGKKVDVDFGDLSSETIKNNEGLSLLNDLTSASENYLYEVGESFSGRHRETGEETKKYKLASSKYSDSFVGNLSTTDRGDYDPNGYVPKERHDQFNALPKNSFFDGHVIISPDILPMKMESSNGKLSNLPRALLTMHELRESHNRTKNKQGYREAHPNAKDAEKAFYLYPAGGYKIRPRWTKPPYIGPANSIN